jgi:hypothetical protein
MPPSILRISTVQDQQVQRSQARAAVAPQAAARVMPTTDALTREQARGILVSATPGVQTCCSTGARAWSDEFRLANRPWEAAMGRRSLILTLAVAAITYGGMLAARAEDWKATGEYDSHGTGGKAIEMEKGHTYAHGESAGKFFNDRGKGSLFDQAEVKCIGSFDTDTNNDRAKQGGYCVITDTDGDHAYWMWESSGTPAFEVKGTFDFTNRTGKYKGITGKNTYRAVGWGYGRMIWNDAQPRKGPVLGLLTPRGYEGPDYLGQHFFGGLRPLGWIDNYIPIML